MPTPLPVHSQSACNWLERALALSAPRDGSGHESKALLLEMMRAGETQNFEQDVQGRPLNWWADGPEWHMNRVGATVLHALGFSQGIKCIDLPSDPAMRHYAESTRLALQWLHARTEHLCRLQASGTAPGGRAATDVGNLTAERWGLPPGSSTLGPAFEVRVLLAAGPELGALARLRMQAVRSPGAGLVLAPVPASAALLLDADFGQMLNSLRQWLCDTLLEDSHRLALQDIALAWDLQPAVGEHLPFAAICGDSAGAAFACAALQVLASHTDTALHAELIQSRHVMAHQFMSAAITPAGALKPVGWVDAKAQAIAPLVRWAKTHSHTGQPRLPLYLAPGQSDLNELPAAFEPQQPGTVPALVQAIARRAEPLSDGQRAFLQAWFSSSPTPAAVGGEPKEDLPQSADQSTGPDLPELLLNPLVDQPGVNPVASLRQAAMQGVARWQRQAGGRLRHQFVPLAVSPEVGRRFGLQAPLAARTEPYEQLQVLLAELDHGAHKAYLLTGLPGAGKTVLLRRHMLDLCGQLLKTDANPGAPGTWQEVPIYVPLNRFPSANPPTPPDDPASADWWADQARAYVLRLLGEQGWQAPMLAPLRQGLGADTPEWRWRWHLDGLNELPMPPDDPRQDRGDRARWVVQGFLDAFKPALKPLLSVRSAHFDDPAWLTVNVLPWEPRHIQVYLDKYFAHEPVFGHGLWESLAGDAILMDLCRRPMHLHMQCELAEAGFAPVATDRASLYLAHLWLRLQRGLGHFGDKAADPHLAGDDLLSPADRRTIKAIRPERVGANDLRRLPLQGLLVRGLMDQAEHQYWRDAAQGRQPHERCKVAVEVGQGIGLRHANGKALDSENDSALIGRWLRAGQALGLLQTNALESTLEFSHQSWGEFFASLRLLDTPPDLLLQQVHRGDLSAQEKWNRAMERPFAHLNQPVSAQAERQALRQRVNQRWAVAMPHLKALLDQHECWLTVPLETFKADTAVNMPQASDQAVMQRFESAGYVGAGVLRFDTKAKQVLANLDRWAVATGLPGEVGLKAGQAWSDEPSAWQALIIKRLFRCFANQIWQHLRAGSLTRPGLSEDALQQLVEEPGHMALPAPSDVQEVFNLALQGLPESQALAWLAAFLEAPHPQAWRVLASAALSLRPRLEPHTPGPTLAAGTERAPRSGVTGLGLWHRPHPLLQHLRRWLLLANLDAGAPARSRLQTAGLINALDAPVAGLEKLAPAASATWIKHRSTAFQGPGLDPLLRLQAGLLLGELGDNIRYERVQVQVDGRERIGIRLKAAHWAKIPASGAGVDHWIGSERFVDSQPAWRVPDGSLGVTRFAHSPAVVMQWQAYADDLRVRGEAAPELWALNQQRFNNPLQPITCVNWFQAQAFTAWAAPLHQDLFPDWVGEPPGQPPELGLPTEVQHEAAVRYEPGHKRGQAQALWPHDAQDQCEPEDMPPDLFNHSNTRWGAPAPVGVFSAAWTSSGIEVMGNVWTWCSSGYTHDYAAKHRPMVMRAQSPDGVKEGLKEEFHPTLALRGGSFSGPADYALAASRAHGAPGYDSGNFGLRWQMSRPIIER